MSRKKQAQAPERGKRLDAFVRRRWANWLPTAGLASFHQPIESEALAQQLASDPEDKQTWPRSRVQRWLSASVTVSAKGAFEAGAALVRLGVPVSGPEALYASGHIPAFLEFLALLAEDDARAAASMAILPFAAFAFEHLASPLTERDGKPRRLGEASQQALEELHSRAWDHAVFQRAWGKYVLGQTALCTKPPVKFLHHPIVTAYYFASSPNHWPEYGLALAFPSVVDWVNGLPVEPAMLARLISLADEVEKNATSFRRYLTSKMRGAPIT